MNALEAASLVMIPSGYEDGTLGSLKPTDGSGDFTFSRGSNISATRVNADGNIEKGYENLLLQSNTFDTTWTTSGQMLTPVGGQSGYDGTTDAWKIQRNDATAQNIKQNISQSGVQTFSVYAKAGNVDFISVISVGGAVTKAIFSLPSDGSGTNTLLDSDNISASIDYISEGWYRISTSFNQPITDIRIYPSETATTEGGVITDAFIYIQDAMLNQGLVAYPYVETTTAPVAGGILEDMPRLDYSNGSCPSLLLEPSRTNLIEYSEYGGASFWSKTNSSVTDNAAISPEGLGNAFELTDNATNSYHWIYQANLGDVTEHRVSFFAKANTLSQVWSNGGGGINNAGFDLLNGTIIQENGTSNPTIEDYGNGWYRCSYTSNFRGLLIATMKDNDNTYAGTGESLYLYGIQSEQDATYPTSYIPTYGVSQTRLLDILFEGAAGLSNFFNPTEGTLFFEVDEPLFRQLTTDGRSIAMRDTTNGEYFQLRGRSNSVYFLLTMCSPNVVVVYNFENNTKYAIKWNGSEVNVFANGEARGSSTQIDTFRPYTLGVASGFGMYTPTGEKFTNITCFPTALSDDKCIELTTI